MKNKFYYKVDVMLNKNGYSFMIASPIKLTDDEVIDVASKNGLFVDDEDVNCAIIDDLVSAYDIKAFGDNIFELKLFLD